MTDLAPVRGCESLQREAILVNKYDLILFIVFMLFFFSEHPTVGSNWQILLLNPLPLFFLPRVIWCAVHRQKTSLHMIYLIWLVFFMIFLVFTPQDFCAPVVSLACILLIRSLGYILYYKKNQIK